MFCTEHYREFISTLVVVMGVCMATTAKAPGMRGALLAATSLAAVIYLYSVAETDQTLKLFCDTFKALSSEIKFALSAAVIGVCYLTSTIEGGSTTGNKGSKSSANIDCPASSDSVTDFDMPAHVPDKDKDLFKVMFDKICAEIGMCMGA